VDKAFALHREIAAKSEELRKCKSLLVLEAEINHQQLEQTETGGSRWIAHGNAGVLARINFPAPGIIAEIGSGSKEAELAMEIAGARFKRLFKAVVIFQPVSAFRERAGDMLTRQAAEKLIGLCEVQISPRVSFELAKQEEQQAGARA
jgi:hypothetical protein